MPLTPNPAIISLWLGWTETRQALSDWQLSEMRSLQFVKSPREIPNRDNWGFFGHGPRLLSTLVSAPFILGYLISAPCKCVYNSSENVLGMFSSSSLL